MSAIVLKSLALGLSLAIAGASLAPAAIAGEPTRKWRKADSERAKVKRKGQRRVETMDDIRANHYDPACNYCGYPSWARAALAPKDGGSGGRP